MHNSIKSMSVLLTMLYAFSLSATTYDELKNEFKCELFERQEGLMAQDEYYSFIESLLNEAEQELELAKYFKKHPDSNLASSYFSTLLNCNVACFHACVRSNDNFNRVWSERLKRLFMNIKSQAGLKDMDVIVECEKTRVLLKQANMLYLKKLGFFKRTLIKATFYRNELMFKLYKNIFI